MSFYLREMGYYPGELPTGLSNTITDVPGVTVGHVTLIHGVGKLRNKSGPIRTGVSIIRPHGGNIYQEKVAAAVHTINGYGKAAGFEQVRELGVIESPIALTNTFNVGIVLDAMLEALIRENPELGVSSGSGSVNIVVGETNDFFLNDIQGRHVKAEHVWQALKESTSGLVEQGAVGAGTGTVCYGWKGGIGSASRVVKGEFGKFTLGALVQSNFGSNKDLIVLGVPAGLSLPEPAQSPPQTAGSVMVILATDAPFDSRQLERLAVRAAAGLARTGAQFSHGSGDFVIAFSTTHRIHHEPDSWLSTTPLLAAHPVIKNAFFRAVVEAVEEAVYNSLTFAETTIGRDDHIAQAIPNEALMDLLRKSGMPLRAR